MGLNDKGNVVSYTVAPGDVPTVVGERLCIYNGIMLAKLNRTRDIHPDQVLRLNPNPAPSRHVGAVLQPQGSR